jgi:hypothetical protein
LFKALINFSVTINFIALHLISSLSLFLSLLLSSKLIVLKKRNLFLQNRSRFIFYFLFWFQFLHQTFVDVSCFNYDLVLDLSWLQKYNSDINWKKEIFTSWSVTQFLIAVLTQNATAQFLIAVSIISATVLIFDVKLIIMRFIILFSEFTSHQNDENSELLSLNVNSQNYINLFNDLYAFKIYKQHFVIKKIIFVNIIDTN